MPVYSEPGVFMPETGNHLRIVAKIQIKTMAMINTGILYPMIVAICTAVSRLPPRCTAQNIPSGIVMPSAITVAKILMKIVFFIGVIRVSIAGRSFI